MEVIDQIQIERHVEALIFASEQSMGLNEIISCLKASLEVELSQDQVLTAIAALKTRYDQDQFSFSIQEIGSGYQFFSKVDYHATIATCIQQRAKKRLSTSAMETIAIIAYKQPITKAEIEHIRGVSCDYAVQKLLEKELIEISGKSDAPGKPVLYSTSKTFMDYFGLRSVKDLPKLKDVFKPDENSIGEISVEENVNNE